MVDDDESKNLLRLVCLATSGQTFVNDAFFLDLLRYQRILERQKKASISRAAIRSWRRSDAFPRRGSALNFLAQYLYWSKSVAGSMDWGEQRLAAFEKAISTIDRIQPQPPINDIDTVKKQEQPQAIDTTILLALKTTLGINNNSSQSENGAFFRGSTNDIYDDASYYISFRYSSNHGAIVKSFLLIRKPLNEVRSTFIFNEFIGGGTDDDLNDHLYRESEGIILKMEKSFYFIGSNFNVQEDKKLHPEVYAKARRASRWKPEGLVMNVYEFDDVRLGKGLFGGLTMNLGDVAQPLVARTALLHVGIKSLLNITVTDDLIKPGEINTINISNNIEETIIRIVNAGAQRFGQRVELILSNKENIKNRVGDLTKKILSMIDNTPAWEENKAGQKSRERLESERQARGAIETFGAIRPRD